MNNMRTLELNLASRSLRPLQKNRGDTVGPAIWVGVDILKLRTSFCGGQAYTFFTVIADASIGLSAEKTTDHGTRGKARKKSTHRQNAVHSTSGIGRRPRPGTPCEVRVEFASCSLHPCSSVANIVFVVRCRRRC
jgi:hypothetical protein